MKRGDIWLGIIVLVVAAWFTIPLLKSGEDASFATITVDGQHYQTVTLTEEVQYIEIQTERGYNKLKVSNGGIEMIEADCPDQLCLGFGHIHRTNETIVCLPHRVIVEITNHSHEGDDLDAVVS